MATTLPRHAVPAADRLAEAFHASTGHVLDDARIFRRKSDKLFVSAALKAGGDRVFVKYKADDADGEIGQEFAALQRYSAAADPSFGVSRPLSLIPDGQGGASLVCEWHRLPSAATWLKLGMPVAAVRRRIMRMAAGWLRRYHEVGGLTERPLAEALDQASFTARFERLVGASPLVDRSGWPDHAAVLARAFALHGAAPVRHSVLHGDFTPSNLLVGVARTIGYDFMARERGAVLADVGRFHSVGMWYGQLGLRSRRGQNYVADCRYFMDHYDVGGFRHGMPAVLLFQLDALLDRVEDLTGKIAAPDAKKTATSRRNLAMVTPVIRHLVEALGEGA